MGYCNFGVSQVNLSDSDSLYYTYEVPCGSKNINLGRGVRADIALGRDDPEPLKIDDYFPLVDWHSVHGSQDDFDTVFIRVQSITLSYKDGRWCETFQYFSVKPRFRPHLYSLWLLNR